MKCNIRMYSNQIYVANKINNEHRDEGFQVLYMCIIPASLAVCGWPLMTPILYASMFSGLLKQPDTVLPDLGLGNL